MPVAEDISDDIGRLGERIRALRTSRGWTLEQLATRARLSKSYISRLEDGDRQPSIAALLSVSQAFGLPIPALFETEGEKAQGAVVRAGSAEALEGNGLTYRSLSSGAFPAGMQPIHVTVPADRSGEDLYRHDGEEWIYLLSGRLRLLLGEDGFDLEPGDAAHFDARLGHRLTALDGRDAELIIVACPTYGRLLSTYL
jgi:transcriptional regulator with XRE-family HTH domain